MAEELLVTSGAKMREVREKGVVLPFPSGNNYRVRNVGAAGLLRRANLPNILQAFAVDAFYNGVTQAKVDDFLSTQEKSERARELMDSFRAVCEEMFMQPRIVAGPQNEDETTIMDVPLADQVWAFKLAFLEVEALFPFRPEPASAVVSVSKPENVSQTAE